MSFNYFLAQKNYIIGSFKSVVEFIARPLAAQQSSQIILPCSLHDLAISTENQSSYQMVDYFTTDSQWLTWWLRLKTGQQVERVYGPELMQAVLANCQPNPDRETSYRSHLFLAADKQLASQLERWLFTSYPDLDFAVYSLGRNVSQKKEQQILQTVIDSQARMVWLGVGSPKQLQLATWLKMHSTPRRPLKIFCVGAAFDFVTGNKHQAPVWIQKTGFEWLFRLLTEPKRLSRRYLVVIPSYLFKMFYTKVR